MAKKRKTKTEIITDLWIYDMTGDGDELRVELYGQNGWEDIYFTPEDSDEWTNQELTMLGWKLCQTPLVMARDEDNSYILPMVEVGLTPSL